MLTVLVNCFVENVRSEQFVTSMGEVDLGFDTMNESEKACMDFSTLMLGTDFESFGFGDDVANMQSSSPLPYFDFDPFKDINDYSREV